jgi:hypothetical protein
MESIEISLRVELPDGVSETYTAGVVDGDFKVKGGTDSEELSRITRAYLLQVRELIKGYPSSHSVEVKGNGIW